jgi:hypothetical protein
MAHRSAAIMEAALKKESGHGEEEARKRMADKDDLEIAKFDADKAMDDAALAAIWREMKEFLQECESSGPLKTKEERDQRHARFVELQRRINARVLLFASTIGEEGSA